MNNINKLINNLKKSTSNEESFNILYDLSEVLKEEDLTFYQAYRLSFLINSIEESVNPVIEVRKKDLAKKIEEYIEENYPEISDEKKKDLLERIPSITKDFGQSKEIIDDELNR